MLRFIINALLAETTSTSYLLVKHSGTLDDYELTEDGTDIAVGITDEINVAADAGTKRHKLAPLLACHKVIANGAIGIKSPVAPAANGKVQAAVANGAYNIIGYALTAATADGDEIWVYFAAAPLVAKVTPSAEVANAFTVTIQTNMKAAFRYRAELIDRATGVIQATAAFTIAETGAGTEVSTTAQGSLVFDTSATGAATIVVTDVAGSSTKGLSLILTPLNVAGVVHEELLQFA